MKNPKTRQPDPISNTVAHEGVNKPMNDPMGTSSNATGNLDTDKLADSNKDAYDKDDYLGDALTDSDPIDPDTLTNEIAEDGQDNLQEGLTPMHRQNIDEARLDEVLVDDTFDDTDYPTIRDIADNDAVKHSHDDE